MASAWDIAASGAQQLPNPSQDQVSNPMPLPMPSNNAPTAPSAWDQAISAGPISKSINAPVKSSAAGIAGAAMAGVNHGFYADLLGLPVDAVINVADLGKAAIGVPYSMITHKPVPEILEPTNRADKFGSSEWIGNKINQGANAVGMSSPINNPVPDDPLARVVYSGGRVIGGSAIPGGAASAGQLIKNTAIAGASGLAAGAAAEAFPNHPELQMAAGLAVPGFAALAQSPKLTPPVTFKLPPQVAMNDISTIQDVANIPKPIDYDVPTFARNGKNIDFSVKNSGTVEIPGASIQDANVSPLENFIKQQISSRYGNLPPVDYINIPGETSPVVLQKSPLDEYIAKNGAQEAVPTLPNENVMPPLSALDKWIADQNRPITIPSAGAASSSPLDELINKGNAIPSSAHFDAQLSGNGAVPAMSPLDEYIAGKNVPPIIAETAKSPLDEFIESGGNQARPAINLPFSTTAMQQEALPAIPALSSAAKNSPLFETPLERTTAGPLPVEQQPARLATLNKIGLDTNRISNITGDKFQSGQDFQTNLLENQVGAVMRDQLAKEQAALHSYGDSIVEGTGGKPNATPTDRGTAILSPLRGLSDYFNSKIEQLYKTADANAGKLASVSPDNLNGLLQNPDFRESLLSSHDGTALLGSIDRQVARFQGTAAEHSGIAPNTVESAENLRKYLNSAWTPQNSRSIGRVKEALDMDVAKVGGENTYREARALHALRANTLDNPKGISSLMSESGPDGINRSVPLEKIADKVTKMPDAQFHHIVDTLRNNMPEELRPQAQHAINEIKAELADKLVSGGRGTGQNQWNAVAFNKMANQLEGKLGIFSPAEMDKIKTLHDAGFIINTPTRYPGAAAQSYNFMQKGLIGAPAALGAAGGAYTFGPVGAGIGSAAGGALSSILKNKVDTSMAQKLEASLKNPMSEPKATFKAPTSFRLSNLKQITPIHPALISTGIINGAMEKRDKK